MHALPRGIQDGDGNQFSGLTCPECFGSLLVKAEGARGQLRCTCRVGHVYGLEELLAAKELRIEERLWEAALALEEMAALLADIGWREQQGLMASGLGDADRQARALRHARVIRRIVQTNVPLRLEGLTGQGSP